MGNPFRDTAALDGHNLNSVFDSRPAAVVAKKTSKKANYQGDVYPILYKNKPKKKEKEQKEKRKKDTKQYTRTFPFQQAFKKLEDCTILIDGKRIKCMDLFFEKCVDGYTIHANELKHFDAQRALVERWITDICTDIKVNYEATLNLEAPEDEKKRLDKQIAIVENQLADAAKNIMD